MFNKDYNWWDYDNSPKFSIMKLVNCSYFEVTANVDVLYHQENNNFQIGFVVYDGKNYYTCMIDVDNKYCIDKIGIDNFSCYMPFVTSSSIYLQIKNGLISFGKVSGDIKKSVLERPINKISNGYVGLVCKKWGEKGELKIRISNLNYYL